MPDDRIIARLAELPELAALREHFDEKQKHDILRLAEKTFANPEGHDRLEWEKKRAFYEGVKAVLDYPVKARRKTTEGM